MDQTPFATPETARPRKAQPADFQGPGSTHSDPPTDGGPVGAPEAWLGEWRPDAGIRPYIRLWRQYRTLMMIVVGVCLAGSILRILLYPQVYMATATILPSGGQGGAGMVGLLASLTGVPPVVGGAPENSSTLFPRIIKSRAVGLDVLGEQYQYVRDGVEVEGTLQDYFQAETVDEALLGLEGLRAVGVDKETGVISVSVRTPEPRLSAAIANRTVAALDRFNNEARHRVASENSSFITERLARAQVELRDAEERLATFKEENLRMSSPELEMELMRLTREVTLKSQIFVTLSNQAEIAQVEEAKNLPMVRILDEAVAPTLPVPAPKVNILVAGVLVGGILAVLLVAGLKLVEHVRFESHNT